MITGLATQGYHIISLYLSQHIVIQVIVNRSSDDSITEAISFHKGMGGATVSLNAISPTR